MIEKEPRRRRRRRQNKRTNAIRLASFLFVGVYLIASIFMTAFLHHQPLKRRFFLGISSLTKSDLVDSVWPHPFVHIVRTRFNQHQGNLTALAHARLVLFETFCLPTMIQQTTVQDNLQNPVVLWIIKVDPNLDAAILERLLELTQPHKFIFVVGSNMNFGVGIKPGGWRGGEEGTEILSSRIYTGDLELLRLAHEAREHRIVIETRLDADDGLHKSFLSTVEADALQKFNSSEGRSQKWMYWCPLNRVDWKPVPPEFMVNRTENAFGMFLAMRSSHVCITAGITMGVAVGVKESDIPRLMHQSLFEELRGTHSDRRDCGAKKCLKMMSDPILSSIRSRTPTSAGMRSVAANEDELKDSLDHDVSREGERLWRVVHRYFNLTKSAAAYANCYMFEHTFEIARDNLEGQCTHGHSCKNSTRKELLQLIHTAKRRTDTANCTALTRRVIS